MSITLETGMKRRGRMVMEVTTGLEQRCLFQSLIFGAWAILVTIYFVKAIDNQSIEWYNGHLLRDTMHGLGEYRWRYLGDDGTHFTYEGHFYCNKMHGYGTMSYPDGSIFTGLFHSNFRWGPGVESHACLREDVGLWWGKQLIRMVWKPATASIAPDLYSTNIGKAKVDSNRIMLIERYKKIGQTNSALDLMKHYGADPIVATEKWNKLYAKHSTDLASPACIVEAFQHDFHKGEIRELEEVTCISDDKHDDNPDSPSISTYYAWSNNKAIVHMMKHSYTHDRQRNPKEINLEEVVSGPRKQFKAAGKHELGCRSLLISSYLGHISSVVELINDLKVHPDVADSLGNTPVMYATCGDQLEIIHFLVEAGANVDVYNDSCVTPLGQALLRFACAKKDITPSGMLQAVLPPPVVPAPPPVGQKVFEWNFTHDNAMPIVSGGIPRTPSRLHKTTSTKKIKSSYSLKELTSKIKTEPTVMSSIMKRMSDESLSEDVKMYNNLNAEFEILLTDVFSHASGVSPIPYLFEVRNMAQEIGIGEEESKKAHEKDTKKVLSKVFKDTMKPSKEMIWQSNEKDEFSSINSADKQKSQMLGRMMLTIMQLLSDGADPNLVKCPQPALFTAILSGCPDLVKELVNYGANINEVYKGTFDSTPLDLAVSCEFSYNNLELIRVILECGANTSHRLRYDEIVSTDVLPTEGCGPNLFHAVLARKTQNDTEDEIRYGVLKLLLDYNCDPLTQFKGRSPVDVAMDKSMDLFDVFIKSPTTNLNAPINDLNQTVLVKMFSLPFFSTIMSSERLQILTNLLLYGADPLIECMDNQDKYSNIFVFAYKILNELEASQNKSQTGPRSLIARPIVPSKISQLHIFLAKGESKKALPTKKVGAVSTKSILRVGMDEVGDYKQAVDLVTECARLLHVRWLQAKLLKELVEIIDKYKHRQWSMILKEHKRKKSTGLWLTTQRCLEIWDILKMNKRKVYNNDKVLRHLLYIVQYYNRLNKIVPRTQLTAEEKSSIECNINCLLKERIAAAKLSPDVIGSWKKPYDEHKFNICFECALPFTTERIECVSCKLVAFCSFDCMKINIDRVNCHPCSSYLEMKYFPRQYGDCY